jgi:biotin-[acetyl-CoA-carboxylase] ligase BirA-like protein
VIRQLHVDACDSTQDLLKEQTTGGTDVTLVSTNKQRSGRGRGSNVWEDMPGTLCFSLIIAPHKILSFTALEMSLLVAKFFENEGCKLGLKWPNDLWNARGLKCGGILVQGSGSQLYAGIGINLNSDQAEFGGVFPGADQFDKKSWSMRIAEYINTHRYTDSEKLKKDWELRCSHMGKQVSITEGSEVAIGIFEGLGSSGEAILHTDPGEKSFYNGTLRVISSDR